MELQFDPGAVALVLLIEALYVRAIMVQRGRGYDPPRLQIVAWHVGIASTAIGLFSRRRAPEPQAQPAVAE